MKIRRWVPILALVGAFSVSNVAILPSAFAQATPSPEAGNPPPQQPEQGEAKKHERKHRRHHRRHHKRERREHKEGQ